MGFKTGFIVGVGVGYVLATRLDPSIRDRIETTVAQKFDELRDDPRVKNVVGTVTSMAEDVVESAGASS